MAKKKKDNENRYPGTDTAAWHVVDVNGKVLLESDKGAPRDHAGFGAANDAARQFERATGQIAFARRA
jgi:hypothetical protein